MEGGGDVTHRLAEALIVVQRDDDVPRPRHSRLHRLQQSPRSEKRLSDADGGAGAVVDDVL